MNAPLGPAFLGSVSLVFYRIILRVESDSFPNRKRALSRLAHQVPTSNRRRDCGDMPFFVPIAVFVVPTADASLRKDHFEQPDAGLQAARDLPRPLGARPLMADLIPSKAGSASQASWRTRTDRYRDSFS